MKDKEKQIFDKYGNYNFPTEIKQKGLNIATTQIEEMAKDLCFSCGVRTISCTKSEPCKEARLDAKNIYNLGYRKIDKDRVVLSREEYESDLTGQYDTGYEFGSKETAEKILNKLLNCHGHISKEHEGEYSYKLDKEAKYTFISKAFILKIIKEFGVEIKED